MYPKINNIKDVLLSIEGHKEFVVMDKGDYIVIDYMYVDNDSFDDPIRLECRGLIFEKQTGKLISRGLEKFFNYGEKFSQDSCDWQQEHIVTDKRDGSMIRAFLINNRVRFGTRAGITEHSEKAERHLTEQLEKVTRELIEKGYTSIWEWTSPENRIILDYKEDELRLLRIRHIETGEYLAWDEVEKWADVMGIKTVDRFNGVKVSPEWIAQKQKEEGLGIEGFVIYWPHNGFSVKVKTEDYTKAHRAVSFLDRENMILPVVLDNLHDDLMPALSEENQKRVKDYAIAVHKEVNEEVSIVEAHLHNIVRPIGLRKEQALWIQANIDRNLWSVYFNGLDGKSVLDSVKQVVLKYPEILLTRWK
jgi:RNA ligase